MKVKELIELLQKENPDARVVVDGYEAGYDEAEYITNVHITPNPDKGDNEKDDRWWDGEFEFTKDENAEIAVLIPRKS